MAGEILLHIPQIEKFDHGANINRKLLIKHDLCAPYFFPETACMANKTAWLVEWLVGTLYTHKLCSAVGDSIEHQTLYFYGDSQASTSTYGDPSAAYAIKIGCERG